MSYNFHIGQDVVAIVNHSAGFFKKDDTFNIHSLRISKCRCNEVIVDIGKTCSFSYDSTCSVCYEETRINDGVIWFSSSCFAPLDELTDISELQEILEQPLFQVK